MWEIDCFRGYYRFLSNFYKSQVEFEGALYSSVEHAYQAAKTLNLKERETIRNAFSPAEAKKLGKEVTLRDDWETVKLQIMRSLLEKKFASGTLLATRLAFTRNAHIVEENRWGDTFWGTCDGVGQNHLGRILMEIRDKLRERKMG